MTLNNAMLGLVALALFAAAVIVSMGPVRPGGRSDVAPTVIGYVLPA